MIYTNKVDNREYKILKKIGDKKDKTMIIKTLNLMISDYDRDQHLMWLTANNYIEAV